MAKAYAELNAAQQSKADGRALIQLILSIVMPTESAGMFGAAPFVFPDQAMQDQVTQWKTQQTNRQLPEQWLIWKIASTPALKQAVEAAASERARSATYRLPGEAPPVDITP